MIPQLTSPEQVNPFITQLRLMTSRPPPHSLPHTVCFRAIPHSSDLDHAQYFHLVYALLSLHLSIIRWIPTSVSEQKSKRANKHTFNPIIRNLYLAETGFRGFLRHIPCAGGRQRVADDARRSTEKTSDGITIPTTTPPTQSRSKLRAGDESYLEKTAPGINDWAGSQLLVLD